MDHPPAPRTFFEDIALGHRDSFGRYEVSSEDIIAFARRYDPQPFHLSDEAAARTHFGRIAASGWHTCAMAMAMLVARFAEIGLASLGAAGVDELRWLKPVHAGDVLRLEILVLDKRESETRPQMGFVRQQIIVINQHDEPVARFIANAMIARRR